MPANSNFAVAHRSQIEAERAEQQRIKALVLNYDRNSTSTTEPQLDVANGDYHRFPLTPPDSPPLLVNVNHTTNRLPQVCPKVKVAKENSGMHDKPLVQPPISIREQGSRKDKDVTVDQGSKSSTLGSKRQQTRKLQMSDVDWYAIVPKVDVSETEPSEPEGKGRFHRRLHRRYSVSTR